MMPTMLIIEFSQYWNYAPPHVYCVFDNYKITKFMKIWGNYNFHLKGVYLIQIDASYR